MIENFEEFTRPLSVKEKEFFLPIFVTALSKKLGKEKIITATQMQAGVEDMYKVTIKPPRIRKIINHIRNNNLIPGLIATSKGYYISEDPDEVQQYIRALDQHEASIRNTKKNMELYLMKLLNR